MSISAAPPPPACEAWERFEHPDPADSGDSRPPSVKKGNLLHWKSHLLSISTCWVPDDEFCPCKCHIVTRRGSVEGAKEKTKAVRDPIKERYVYGDDSCMLMWQQSHWFTLFDISSDKHVALVCQQTCLTVCMYLSLSDIYVHVCLRVLIFMSLFVSIFTCPTVTSGPQRGRRWLQLGLNLHPASETDTGLVVPRVSHSLTPLVWPLCSKYSCLPHKLCSTAVLLFFFFFLNDLSVNFLGKLFSYLLLNASFGSNCD